MSEKKTITINGVEVPAPEREPLRIGQTYWVPSDSLQAPLLLVWDADYVDAKSLERGWIHLTRENAQAHIDAMRRANKGEAK